MLKLGEIQSVVVTKKTDFGLYVKAFESKDEDAILLPKKEAPEAAAIGDHIEVFVYKDSDDRYIATTRTPKVVLGTFAVLKVVQVTSIGAFLDWGLLKDLLLPFKEQVGKVVEGESYLVALYIDKSNRLCATMKTGNRLSTDHNFVVGTKAKGIIYNIHDDLGVFVAVDGKYQGLLPKKEITKKYRIGEEIEFKIARIKDDGRMDLTIKEQGFAQMEAEEEVLYNALVAHDGFLQINDDSSKEVINATLEMSKRSFKRALGRLMKAGKVKQVDDGICLIQSSDGRSS